MFTPYGFSKSALLSIRIGSINGMLPPRLRLKANLLARELESRLVLQRFLIHLLIAYVKLLRWTCRVRPIDDPREEIRNQGQTYIFAALHAQQLATIVPAEPGTGALVSRSEDGELIAKVLETTGVIPIRGSGGARRKGGAAALLALVHHVQSGQPTYLAVDGPKGPRGTVHPGVAMLSQKTGAPVLPLSFIPQFRYVIKRSWDRVQIPLPFSRIDCRFGEPLYPIDGESVRDHVARIQQALMDLEQETDPGEAEQARLAAEARATAKAKRSQRAAKAQPASGSIADANSTSPPEADAA
ncbi:lysophospholipid acyltransferase family protein [Roseiconus lacunae]|uniref:Lysophospholipid acyltransferase family protein n=2 Tax=Roseiconus lacunae TaxID=2605694 RepID=A0ABT7PNC3_9BACT|nr:lysophospholipid acyltransferase family protein [Roseiconus lacunae]MDM4017973.1 lysophospholipid acyltransferase family protein [Roseiconus lacunae]